jgi:hypothetical protein
LELGFITLTMIGINCTQESFTTRCRSIEKIFERVKFILQWRYRNDSDDRDLELNGKSDPKFFTLIWEFSSERWQAVKESCVTAN